MRRQHSAATRHCWCMPSDHLVRDQVSFAAAVAEAAPLAAAGWIVTFGIAPTHPETGYGYIECGAGLDGADAHRVTRFIEKPPLADAAAYIAGGQLRLEFGHVLLHSDDDTFGAATACADDAGGDARRLAGAAHRQRHRSIDARDRLGVVRRGARYFRRLRGHGKSDQGCGRPRTFRLERHRFVESDIGIDRIRRVRQQRPGQRASLSTRTTPSYMPATASLLPSASTTSLSSTRRTRCWSHTAIICSAFAKWSAN